MEEEKLWPFATTMKGNGIYEETKQYSLKHSGFFPLLCMLILHSWSIQLIKDSPLQCSFNFIPECFWIVFNCLEGSRFVKLAAEALGVEILFMTPSTKDDFPNNTTKETWKITIFLKI